MNNFTQIFTAISGKSFNKFVAVVFFFVFSTSSWGQLFQQQFATNLASFSNSNSTNATYINATPSNAQLTYLGSSGTGAVISVASNKLTIARTANGWGFARGAAFSGPPSSLMVQFDYSTTGATAAATSALVFAVGGGTSNGAATTSLTNSDIHTRLAFNCTATSGQFVVRDMAGSVNGATTYTGTQTILFVLNNSGASLTYKAPNGTYETVANDKSDIWVGTSKQLDEVSATTATQTLSYFKCISTSGNQTVNFGNMLMDPIPSVPTSNAATSVAATSFTANWTAVSGVSGYRVDVATDAAFTSMVSGYDNLYVSGQATNSLNVTGLSANTTYYYRVRGASQYTVGEFAGGNSASQNLTTPVLFTITWCNASPATATIDEGGAVDVFGQVYAAGLTDAVGQGAGMTAEIGYRNSNTDPSAGGWTWTTATYVGDVGNNDNYKISLGAGLTPGTYYYATRFKLASGSYVYGGTAGLWTSTSENGVLTVNSNLVDWCNVQYPTSGTISEGDAYNVYAQVYEPGVTNTGSPGAGITAWVGYSTSNTNPNSGGWTWVATSFNADQGNNDEYVANIATGLAPGTYYYASRFQKTGSTEYQYGGTGGVWSSNSGVLTVNPNVVDWANVQYPVSGTITAGDNYNVYAQVYEPGVTNVGSPGAGITAWIGYSSSNTNPNTGGWTWVAASFNTDSGNNDEYVANIGTSLTPGTYYYASRFLKSGSSTYVYGGTAGVWSSDNGTLTVNAAVPVVTAGSPTGTYGTAFSYNIIATNAPTSYAVSSGTLPAGLSLNTTTGEISGTPTAAGSSSVSVTATNSGGTSTPATLSFTIAQANQTITFGALSAVTYGTAPYALTATASSTLAVTYASSNTAVATVSGSTITIVGVGTTTITASQAGDSNYNPATDVNQALTVNQKGLTISGVTANNKVQDGTTAATLSGTPSLVGVETVDLGNVTISGTPTATFASSSVGTGIAVTVTGYTLSGSAAGNYTLSQPTGLTADIAGLGAPVAIDATTILTTSFDANWNAVVGATSYLLDVSTSSTFYGPNVNIVSWDFPNNPDDAVADGGIAANTASSIAVGGGVTTLVFTAGGATTNSANAVNWQSGNGTKYWEVNFSTQGHYGIKVSSKQRGSNTAPRDFKLQYKIGSGGTYTDVTGGTVTVANNYTAGVLSALALPSACDNQTSVYLRWVMTSNISVNGSAVVTGGSANIDDILIEGNAPSFVSGYEGLNVGNVTTYTVSGLAAGTIYYYRVRAVNGSVQSANSNVITVYPLSVGGTVSSDQSVCSGSAPANLTLTGNVGTVVKWQSSSDTAFTSPTDIASTSTTLTGATIGALTTVTYFRAVVQSGANPTANSSYITVTINPLPTLATITATPACENTPSSVTLTGLLPNTAGSFFYTNSMTGATQYPVSGTSDSSGNFSFNTPNLPLAANGATITIVSGMVTATGCTTTFTGKSVNVVVDALPTASIVSNNGPAVCSGSTITFNVSGTSGATITYNLNGGSNTTATLTGGVATITVTGATASQTLNLVSVANGACTVTIGTNSTVLIESTTWDGTTWSNGTPTSTKSVIFTGNYSVTGNLDACSITVSNSAVVSVASGYDVNLNGALTVSSGSFTLNNNANLLQADATAVNTGNIIVKRNSNPLIRLDYTLWGSPVTGQNLFAFSPLTSVSPTVRFYTYNTSTNVYNSVANYNTTDFATGKGYLIRLPFNHPTAPAVWAGSFTGVPNNGTKTITLDNIDASHQFNAVGNPYPSPISIAQFANDNSNNIEPTLYFWRKTNNSSSPSYCTWNTASATFGDNGEAYTNDPSGVIQTGQGFIVEAKDGMTSLEFNNGQRIGDNAGQFFRNGNAAAPTTNEAHRIWVNLTGASNEFSQAVVGYFTNATQGADDFDSKFFNDGAVALSTIIGSTEYVIQGRSVPFVASDVVPLNYRVTTAGTYTFTIDHADGLFAAGTQDVYIKDNLYNTYNNLNTAPYSFTTEAGTFADRFELVYQNTLSADANAFTANSIKVIHQQNEVVVNSGNALMANVKVYDVRGRLLAEKKDINASETKLNVGTTNQVLLVQVTTTEGVKATKKVIN